MNKEELEWMNKTGKSLREYYATHSSTTYIDKNGMLQNTEHHRASHFNAVTTRTASAIFDSEVLEELKLLRKDTQALGKSISHKTTVDVHGELRVDSKHITALVETNRRKLSRRG